MAADPIATAVVDVVATVDVGGLVAGVILLAWGGLLVIAPDVGAPPGRAWFALMARIFLRRPYPDGTLTSTTERRNRVILRVFGTLCCIAGAILVIAAIA